MAKQKSAPVEPQVPVVETPAPEVVETDAPEVVAPEVATLEVEPVLEKGPVLVQPAIKLVEDEVVAGPSLSELAHSVVIENGGMVRLPGGVQRHTIHLTATGYNALMTLLTQVKSL